MAKVFAWWVVGTSVVVGVWLTVQTIYALKIFSAASRTGGIVVVSALRQMAPCIVIFAACNTLVVAIEQRTKRNLPPPREGLPWSAFIWLYAALPIANGVIMATSFVTNTIAYDGSVAEFWESIRRMVTTEDFPFGMTLLLILAILSRVTAPGIMQRLAQVPGWLLLKYFLAGLTYIVISINLGEFMAMISSALFSTLEQLHLR